MKPSAEEFSRVGDQYLGVPYSQMDCQAFVEKCLADVGIHKDLPGSNAWYRAMTWSGSPDQCKAKFGTIPVGAFLFILKHDGGEPDKYKADGLGNASHIGIYTGRGKGAINSSYSRGCVCESYFAGKAISGGWNIVGLWDALSYGEHVDRILTGQESPKDEGGGGGKVTKIAIVESANDKGVNLRSKPVRDDRYMICTIPEGKTVEVLDDDGTWSHVVYDGVTGYAMSKYLMVVAESGGDDPGQMEPQEPSEGMVTVHMPMDMAVALWEILDGVIGHG